MAEQNLVLNNRYKLLERIGSGGMSVVYRAQDLLLGRIVAVKVLHDNLTDDLNFSRRFQREAYSAANLSHPNIVTVHDIGQQDDRYYMVMEYVDGRTLKQLVRLQNQQGQPMPISRALDLIIQVCAGIGYAHRANLVHCDVKSQNILVTRDDQVKVADFGIARAMSEATQHTVDDQIWGTPHYFSPEQAAGQPATPASDVYSIGVVLFELLTGRLPFTADTHTALALKHMHEPPPHVSQFNPAVPQALDDILQKVMSKEPAARYRTADQLGRILMAYRESSLMQTGAIPMLDVASSMPVYEQPTAIFTNVNSPVGQPQPSTMDTIGRTSPQGKVYGSTTPPFEDGSEMVYPVNASDGERDWVAVSLGVLAVVALLGLIPLWYFVYQAYSG
ncbi:MAG: protein kinase [Chloroflexota bacterium]